MTLHTVMPLELVLEGLNAERDPWIEARVGDVLLQLEPIAPGRGKVVRILDGPLESYLDPNFEPGSILSLG
ncbi:YlzJ-like family protein [Paenibacillus pasadenensis]|uniref:YlzJ-like family protein n=1 Tax=Paenibacillus pasadenensis TaxID=217090 RepID=UPI00203B5562|nr:YlzJ-like family protein [Paenibacillus pasadenensis]MCM3745950.1 YlzJ-like family protein [Paenibacillus pasadenensis]